MTPTPFWKNMDFVAGAVALAGAAALALLAGLGPEQLGDLWAESGAMALLGAAALSRFVSRRTDGDPGSPVASGEVLTHMGLPQPASSAPEDLTRRIRAGWVSVDDELPGAGDKVVAVVAGELVLGEWGDDKLRRATKWRWAPRP